MATVSAAQFMGSGGLSTTPPSVTNTPSSGGVSSASNFAGNGEISTTPPSFTQELGQGANGQQINQYQNNPNLPASFNDIDKAGMNVFNFLTGGLQHAGELIAGAFAAPSHVNQYSSALDTYNQTTQSLVQSLKQQESIGQNTNATKTALRAHLASAPQLQDYVKNPAIQQLMREGVGKQFEQIFGTLGAGALNAYLLAPGGLGESVAKDIINPETTLGSKIVSGAKSGASFGTTQRVLEGASQGSKPGAILGDGIIGGLTGGALGGATEGVLGSLSDTLQGKDITNIGKVPKPIENFLNNVPDATDTITQARDLTKANIANPDLDTAPEVQGHEKLAQVVEKGRQMVDDQGKRMGAILENPEVGGSSVDASKDVSKLETTLNNRSAGNTKDDNAIIKGVKADIVKLFGGGTEEPIRGGGTITVKGDEKNPTLKEVDDFLRTHQPIDYSRKMTNTSAGAAIDSFVHDLNETAKNAGDEAEAKAGITTKEYRGSNDEYARLVGNVKGAEKDLGPLINTIDDSGKNVQRYQNADAEYRAAGTPKGLGSKNIRALIKQTGIPVGQQAGLTKFVEDIYTKDNPMDAFRDARVSYNIPIAIIRNLQSALRKGESDPDAIVAKMLEILRRKN